MSAKFKSCLQGLCLVFGLPYVHGEVVPSEYREDRVYTLGDDHFQVVIETDLDGWIETVGPRFDRTGAVRSVQVDGKEFLVEGGLADEFNQKWIAPPGYYANGPGGSFLKVGVGLLKRHNACPYIFRRNYPVLQLAEQNVVPTDSKNRLQIEQSFSGESDWGYQYTKTYRIDEDQCSLTIEYALTNTGQAVMELDQYNHNWFRLGGGSEPKHYSLSAEFISGMSRVIPPEYQVEENTIRPVVPFDSAFFFMTIANIPIAENFLEVFESESGMRVEIGGDFRVARFAVLAGKDIFCPELFGFWRVDPSRTIRWERQYFFRLN
ncbi:hypothetical protein [Puniceicoccus vermicola]|uniref:Uncharacterized protein n=1 Tax=Puniceicoccus vermicola TaxID=388746 RepID=A0A7X1E651_9BACT|nr:hypothetical protein [Puniceicoccus vermicola]MBC2603859.1 hypothetical protein [Puniceicoccus vermicola]